MRRQNALETVEVTEPEAVGIRLADMGIPPSVLAEAGRRGQQLAGFVTKAHPVGAAGSYAYHETNAALRIQLATRGWELSDRDNIARVISPDRKTVLTALSGNKHTGREKTECRGAYAQTRRPRKEGGRRLVRRNAQLLLSALLFTDESEKARDAIEQTDGPTWFLLYYRDGDTLRLELSLAQRVNDNGDLIEWSERLLLPDVDIQAVAGNSAHIPPADEVDVPVERRAS